MGSYNIRSIRKKVIASRKFQKQAKAVVQQRFLKAKKQMLAEFDNHPVTTEISQGAGARNTSNTLAGYGNLFTFIGFDGSYNPILPVRMELDRLTQIKKFRTTSRGMEFTISAPRTTDLRRVSVMPWETGRSWVEGIEKGISGFSYYMYTLLSPKSRSGGGIQIDNKLRGSGFRATNYLTPILNKFIHNI